MSCFHKVVRKHYSGELSEFLVIWCEIFSWFRAPKIIQIGSFFCWVIQNIRGAFLRQCLNDFENSIVNTVIIVWTLIFLHRDGKITALKWTFVCVAVLYWNYGWPADCDAILPHAFAKGKRYREATTNETGVLFTNGRKCGRTYDRSFVNSTPVCEVTVLLFIYGGYLPHLIRQVRFRSVLCLPVMDAAHQLVYLLV